MTLRYIAVTEETHARFVEIQDALALGSDEFVNRLLDPIVAPGARRLSGALARLAEPSLYSVKV